MTNPLEALIDQAAAMIHQQETAPAADVPASEVPASGAAEANSAPQYTVQYGDTLASIATACGTSQAQLMAWNGLINDALIVGSTLRVG